ncbi:hypothetical protein PMAC_000691 [Pneumocystis sp. 'macacae']|nr:hypothetical protein PMAC_000691 [Pneumocystis sp. 'macacae']
MSIFDDPQKGPLISKLKLRMSSTANNLMIASKNHALNKGLSPISLLDAAAFHLTATIIELVKIVKLRTSDAANPLGDENEELCDIKEPDIDAFSPLQCNLSTLKDRSAETQLPSLDFSSTYSTKSDTSKIPKTTVLKTLLDSDFDSNLQDFKVRGPLQCIPSNKAEFLRETNRRHCRTNTGPSFIHKGRCSDKKTQRTHDKSNNNCPNRRLKNLPSHSHRKRRKPARKNIHHCKRPHELLLQIRGALQRQNRKHQHRQVLQAEPRRHRLRHCQADKGTLPCPLP